jgi:hypothetical protein
MTTKYLLMLPLLCLCALSAFSLSSGGSKNKSGSMSKTETPDFSMSAGGRVLYNGHNKGLGSGVFF